MIRGYEKEYKILIVDDSEANRAILDGILADDYEIIQAGSGKSAIEILQKESDGISLVLLDLIMPETNGYDVLTEMNRSGTIKDIPVIMISAENSPGFINKAFDLGASDYIGRPFEATVVKRRVKNTITLYAKQRRLADTVANQIYEKEKNSSLMVSILSHIVEFRNGESGAHVIHINIITECLLKQLVKKSPKYCLSISDIRLISTASSLHDIGKIAIPDEILNKPGKLTQKEYEVMKTHSSVGASMLRNLSEYQNEPLMKVSYEICRWHHERYDGKGYPDGLVGDDIPISAQVVSIADVYDALTSKRCYKDAYSHERALEMICGGECGTFNPLLIECLMDIREYLEKELRSNTSSVRGRKELYEVTNEILQNNDLSSSGQKIRQLEFDRAKAEFFEEEISDIAFSYQSDPPILKLSEKAADMLKLNRIIPDPLKNHRVKEISDESLYRLADRISHAAPEDPVVSMPGRINIGGKPVKGQFRCKTLWISAEKPIYIGTAGVFFSDEPHKNNNEHIKEKKGMDLTLLKQAGIDTDSALERFINNEALFAKMLKKFLNDSTFESLVKAVSENKGDEALIASHTLKGLCGNLSFTKLFEMFSQQVALMRADKWNDACAMMPQISSEYAALTNAVGEWIDDQNLR